MNGAEFRSPFVERVFQLGANWLPRGHEEAMKQAFYNVTAIFFFVLLCSATMAVYFILEPFVKPLLWAILVGSVLHPLKHRSVIMTKGWLTKMNEDNTLLLFGFLSFPLKVVDLTAEWIGTVLFSHIKLLLFLSAGIPLLYLVQNHCSISDLYYSGEHALCEFMLLLDSLASPQEPKMILFIGTCILGLAGVVKTLMASQDDRLRIASNVGWVLAICFLFVLLGSLSVFVIVPMLLLGFVALAIYFKLLDDDADSGASNADESQPISDDVAVNVSTPTNHGLSRLIHCQVFSTAIKALSTTPTASSPTPSGSQERQSSNRYIYGALWACLVVQVWRHMWLLHFIPIPFVCFLIKTGGSYFNLWAFLRVQKTKLVDGLASRLEQHKDQLFPRPLQWLHKAVVYIDRMIIRRLIHQLDAVVTVVIIFVVVVLTVLASVFVAVHIYGESVHLLQLGTSLVNRTVHHPEARQWLPQGIDQMVNLDTVVDNAYAYGKTGIATLVRNSIKEKDPVRAAQIERVLLEALDRMQTAWLSQGEPSASNSKSVQSNGKDFNSTAVKPPLLRRLSSDFLNLTVLVNYGRENVGSIFSILESVWTILKGNLSLVFKSATAVLSILIGGGTTILNFLVNGVVFLTALYYLLVASDSQYKPIQLFSFLSPGGGNTLGTAMEEAINTVCLASFKFSVFYGLWTWLMHTVFRANFVVIPAALAALLGAVPFLGTYWAALPASLDLWLAQQRGAEAVLLMAFQFAPTLWVDAAFYAEIKGGGHPYLTGLAVAGGIFWLGFEGAIIGPLLLCVLLVVVSVYTTLVQSDPQSTQPPSSFDSSSRLLLHRRLLRTDTVG